MRIEALKLDLLERIKLVRTETDLLCVLDEVLRLIIFEKVVYSNVYAR